MEPITTAAGKEPPVPYWRLSSFYFWYFALLGVLSPYWALYFQSEGFSAEQIGLLLGTMMGTKVVAPNLWAWLSEQSGKPLRILRLGVFLALLCFSVMLWPLSFTLALLVIIGYSFFVNAILPQLEAITLHFLSDKPQRYSQIRLWGSVGFLIAVVVVGYWFESQPLKTLPVIACFMLGVAWLCSLFIPAISDQHKSRARLPFASLIRQRGIIAFLISGLLMQVAHGSYYSFFSIHLSEVGYSNHAIGWMWALGVIAEVLIFTVIHRWLPRYGVKELMLTSLILAAIRWWVIGWHADSWFWLCAAQLLHAFTFGVFHSACIEGLRQFFGSERQARGQALYVAFCYGVGGASGSWVAGFLWAEHGAHSVFGVATVVSLVAVFVVALWYPGTKKAT
ncbi:MFS transporter [Porticoccaceae bacterium LTM1]|nr:MFS transporter [Porticoccaceae bacterium LTM1]